MRAAEQLHAARQNEGVQDYNIHFRYETFTRLPYFEADQKRDFLKQVHLAAQAIYKMYRTDHGVGLPEKFHKVTLSTDTSYAIEINPRSLVWPRSRPKLYSLDRF